MAPFIHYMFVSVPPGYYTHLVIFQWLVTVLQAIVVLAAGEIKQRAFTCLADILHSAYQFKQGPYGHKLSPLWKESHPIPQEDCLDYYIWAIHNLQF